MPSSNPLGQTQKIRTYAELQRYMQIVLREQHPDWVGPDGDCSAYKNYEKRFAELLTIFAAKRP